MTFDDEFEEFARRSLGLSLWVDAYHRRRPGYLTYDQQACLIRASLDEKMKRGEPIERSVPLSFEGDPVDQQQALEYLRWPWLIDTENYRGAFRACDHGGRFASHVHPEIKRFAAELLWLGREQGVPLIPEAMYISPADARAGYVRGVYDQPPELNVHCYGRAVQVGHLAMEWWPIECELWLIDRARAVARRLGLNIGIGGKVPGQFIVADEDGVLCEYDGRFPVVSTPRAERERMWKYYSGGERETLPAGYVATLKSGIEPACWWKVRDNKGLCTWADLVEGSLNVQERAASGRPRRKRSAKLPIKRRARGSSEEEPAPDDT